MPIPYASNALCGYAANLRDLGSGAAVGSDAADRLLNAMGAQFPLAPIEELYDALLITGAITEMAHNRYRRDWFVFNAETSAIRLAATSLHHVETQAVPAVTPTEPAV